ncbi:PAS domain-containing protein [Aquibaculum arenosum]|nr:PAS domain-containing protein [Fodinicurvata sp. CAU 1616]
MSDLGRRMGQAGGIRTEQQRLLRLHRYWLSICGKRPMPTRKDIDPAAVSDILKDVMVVEALSRDPDEAQAGRPLFRYRLIGTGVTQAAGYDLTGATFDDLPDPAFRRFCQRLFEGVMADGKPRSAAGRRLIACERWAFDSLVLPLSDTGDLVTGFLAALVYPREWNHGLWPRPSWNWHRNNASETDPPE